MVREKINWLLILQGWAMLWVVIGHSPLNMSDMPYIVKLLFDVAYSFHMPLFILISGFLFYKTRLSWRMKAPKNSPKRWSYKSIMADKLQRLGIPFVVFTLIAMIMKALFPSDMARPSSISLGEFIHAILYPSKGPLLEMWFVAVIMWMFALTPLWEVSLKSKKNSILTFGILVLLNISINNLPFGTFLCLRDTIRFGVYFYLGMLASKYSVEIPCRKYKYRVLIIAFVSYMCCFAFSKFYFIGAISAIAFSVGLSFILDKYVTRIFSSFRNYTYQIFLMSIFAQIAVKMIYKRVATMGEDFVHPMVIYAVFFLICLGNYILLYSK